MATTVTAATLTVTIQESITLNNLERGSKNVLSIASINEVDNRVMSVPITEVTVATLGTAVAGGQFIRTDMKYLRVTNLDAANFVRLRISRASATKGTVDFKLEAGKSFVLCHCDFFAQAADAAFSAFTDIETIKAQADTLPVDIEVFTANA
mgnify:CR=1 FL=1